MYKRPIDNAAQYSVIRTLIAASSDRLEVVDVGHVHVQPEALSGGDLEILEADYVQQTPASGGGLAEVLPFRGGTSLVNFVMRVAE